MPKPFYKKPIIWTMILLILLGVGSWLFFFGKKSEPVVKENEGQQLNDVLPPIDPSVEITLASRGDKKEVKLTIKKIPQDTVSLEYELSYFTGTGLSRGTFTPTPVDLKGATEFERDILLGTCSRNVCSYDEGVKSITLTVKFNSAKGSSQFKKEFPL